MQQDSICRGTHIPTRLPRPSNSPTHSLHPDYLTSAHRRFPHRPPFVIPPCPTSPFQTQISTTAPLPPIPSSDETTLHPIALARCPCHAMPSHSRTPAPGLLALQASHVCMYPSQHQPPPKEEGSKTCEQSVLRGHVGLSRHLLPALNLVVHNRGCCTASKIPLRGWLGYTGAGMAALSSEARSRSRSHSRGYRWLRPGNADGTTSHRHPSIHTYRARALFPGCAGTLRVA